MPSAASRAPGAGQIVDGEERRPGKAEASPRLGSGF